jgi:hypothetical protein
MDSTGSTQVLINDSFEHDNEFGVSTKQVINELCSRLVGHLVSGLII